MSVSPKLSMHISFQDFEFSEEAIYPKTDVACAIFLNENCIDKLYLNKDSVGKFSLTNPDDRLRFIFRSKQTGAIIGCISFLLKAFDTNIDKQFTQWLTLFDCPEDDEFDGNLGEDDEETPRVLFQYQIFSDNIGSDTENTPKKQQFLRTEVSDIQHKFNSNMSYVSGMTEFGSPIKMEPHLYSDAKNTEVEEIMIASVAPQFQYSFHHHHEEFSKENNSYFETKETPRLEPKIDPVIENKGIFRLEQPPNEAEIEPLDLQLDSLQAVIEKNSERSEPNQEPVQVRLETNDEGEYLLYLENERNTKLQEILKLTESRLVNIEAAYKDLDIKSKFQIQGLVDKNRILNQDNQDLREKIQELEEKLDKVSEPAEAYSEKSRQLDLAAVDDHRAKNQTLEKLNLSLKEELERIKSICHQEKQLNQNLQAQLEIISNQYKQDIVAIKEENNGYVEQLNQLSEELFMCREKYSRLDLEVNSIGTIKESLERELQIKSKAIVSLKKEAHDYQELTEDLRKTIREFKANSEREIAVLRQDIAVLEDKIRDQDKSNKEANEYIREMQREIECFQAKAYEERVNMLMKEVESCEITIKDLKEVVENCKCGVLNENMKAQSETESDRDKRAKLLEKFQTLTYQYQEQMVKMQVVRKENFELSTRVEELEREKEQYSHYLDQVKPLQDENEHLWSLLSRMKNHLALNAAELVNQAGRVNTQKAVIKNLNQKLQPSDIKTGKSQLPQMELKQPKNEEFKRSYVAAGLNRVKNIEPQAQKSNNQNTNKSGMQSKQDEERKEDKEVIENMKGTKQLSTGPSSQENSKIENSSKLKSSEIDQKLKELMKKTKILMKFVRIGEGVYVFGSKRVQVRSIDGKLVIKIKGGYIFIEEFIRLYTHEELTKLKTMKGEISYTNIEDENLPSDVDKAHIISDNNAITDQDSFRGNNGNINGSLSLQCSPRKEEVSGKKMLAEGMRSSSLSYREPNWPVKKEIDSSRENTGTVNRNKETGKTRHGHTKGAPSVEYSPRFQQHEDDVRKWASNNYSEQKSFRENNNGKKK